MKKNTLFTLVLFTFGLTLVTSCKKNRKPALIVEGNYTGSFEGTYNEFDTLTSDGYAVQVASVNDNKIKVTGKHFDDFEVLVTTNGLNIEPVSQSDPYLENFLYIGDDKKIQFTFNKGVNEAKFIGTK